MLEQLLTLPGYLYQIGNKHYYLGKWICKECTDLDATDCVAMYEMCREGGEINETGLYFQKIRAYSDFALDIPYNPAKIKEELSALLAGLSDAEKERLKLQITHVEEDSKKYA